jgi:hypothetical protein
MFAPPKAKKPAAIAIRATAPKISNQRGINSPLEIRANPVRKTLI